MHDRQDLTDEEWALVERLVARPDAAAVPAGEPLPGRLRATLVVEFNRVGDSRQRIACGTNEGDVITGPVIRELLRWRFGVRDSNGHERRAHGGLALDGHTRR